MPIEIEVLENQKELDSIEGPVYLILKNNYSESEEQGYIGLYSRFALIDYSSLEKTIEVTNDGNSPENLEEFAKLIKESGEEKFYTFPAGYLHDEYNLGPDDEAMFVRKYGIGKLSVILANILNREYNEIMSRQLCLNL